MPKRKDIAIWIAILAGGIGFFLILWCCSRPNEIIHEFNYQYF